MNTFKIYLNCYQNKIKKLLLLFILVLIGTILETVGIGLLIPLLGLMVNDIATIKSEINIFFENFADIKIYLLSLSQVELILLSIFAVFIVFSVKTAFLLGLGLFSSRFIYETHRRLAQKLFESYLSRPYSFFLNKNSAELMKNTTGEVGVFVGQVLIPIVYLFTEFTVVIFLTTFLLIIEPIGTILVFSSFLIFILSLNFFSKSFLFNWGLKRQKETGLIIKTLQESFGAIKEVKLLDINKELAKKFGKHNFATQRAESNMMAFQNVPKYGLEFFAICCFLGFLVYFINEGKNISSVIPLLGIYAATAFRLLPSANRILANVNAIRYGAPVIQVIKDELSDVSREEKIIHENNYDLNMNFNELKFENVCFKYDQNKKDIFRDLTFKISKGDVVGIYGPSGSGKSTLVDLICGLLEPSEGQIYINKKNISELKKSWQNILGYVPQSPFFFDDTIQMNICFSYDDNKIDKNKLFNKIGEVELSEFIESLPLGVKTFIGEKAARISGGQKQRIAIARALYRDCQFLVLDEATSALDQNVEEKILKSLNKIKQDKTLMMVSHKRSTLQFCNKILKIDLNGEVKICKYQDVE